MTERFKEVANDWLNTGGHCMVDITTVYDKQDKKLLYMLVGCDWMTLATFDYVSNEVPSGTEPEDYIIYNIEMSSFTTEPAPWNTAMNNMPEEYFELFNHGLLSYIKNTFKYDHQLTRLAVEALPVELRRMVTDEYAAWLDDNEQLVATDGSQIIVDDRFKQSMFTDNELAAEELLQHLHSLMPADVNKISDEQWEKFYEEKLQIIYCGKLFTFGNGADVFSGLEDFVKFIIDNQ